jgi:hypothetical protein
MSDESIVEERPLQSPFSRRTLLKAGAVVGGTVWVAPVIDSFVNRAAAASGPSSTCTQMLNGSGFSVVSVLLLDPTTETAYEVVYTFSGSNTVSSVSCQTGLPGGSCAVVFGVPAGYTLAPSGVCPNITYAAPGAGVRPTLTLTDSGTDSYTVSDWVIHQGNCCTQLSKGSTYPCAPSSGSTIPASGGTAVFNAPSPCANCTSPPPC